MQRIWIFVSWALKSFSGFVAWQIQRYFNLDICYSQEKLTCNTAVILIFRIFRIFRIILNFKNFLWTTRKTASVRKRARLYLRDHQLVAAP